MKINNTDNGYELEVTNDDKAHIWIVLNEYRQYRLTATDGEQQILQVFLDLLNGVPDPTAKLLERARQLAQLRSEEYNQRYQSQ